MQDLWLFIGTEFGANDISFMIPFLEVGPTADAINTLLTSAAGQARLQEFGLEVPLDIKQGGLSELVWQFNQNQGYRQDPITCGVQANSINFDAVEVSYLTDGNTITADFPPGSAKIFCVNDSTNAPDPLSDFNPIEDSASHTNLKLMEVEGNPWFRKKNGDICFMIGNTNIEPTGADSANITPTT